MHRSKLVLLPSASHDAAAPISDAALLAACANGDLAALGTLYDRHANTVVRFVSRLAHVDAADAEDLVHDVFLAAFHGARRFEGGASVRTWLLAIAANHARMQSRSAQRRRAAAQRLALMPSPHAGPDTQQLAEWRRARATLEHALAELSHELRVAFLLCDVEQVAGVEAARALGVREGTLYRRLHEARKRLRRAVEAGEKR